MAATRLSDSQKQELVARFCGGASLQQLAKSFGCSPTTVSRTAKAAIDLADYELLLKQLKAQRSGSSQGDGDFLGELPLHREEDDADAKSAANPGAIAPTGFGDAIDHGNAIGAAASLTPTEPGERPELATTVGLYGLEGPSPEPVELPDLEEFADQQGALELPGTQEFGGASPELSLELPSPLADAVAEPPLIQDVPSPIPGRRRRSSAASASTPANPLFDTDQAPADLSGHAGLETGFVGAQSPLGTLPLPATAPAPGAGPTPEELVPAAGPGELAIDDADDFGAEDGEDDLSDDPGEEICFAQGETFVAIPVGPIIDDLAIHEAVPFSAAVLPSSAFLLVDKTVELQARPLRELPELGRLAADELDRQALVVFVNPRQAKRQCGRTQRVIPLPDPSLLERTAPYLMAQGITRLVIEGALYALPGA
jgi:hypothetical protein